jgi:hypothetical protein
MQATFVELPPFRQHRDSYLKDDEYRALQAALMENPEAGDVIKGTGGLRKLRFGDAVKASAAASG